MARIVEAPDQNLGIFQSPPAFSFNVEFEDPTAEFIRYEAIINLPGIDVPGNIAPNMGSYIRFIEPIAQRPVGADISNNTVSLMNIFADVSGWDGGSPLLVDDPNTPEIEGRTGPIWANLWDWLPENQTFSITVRLVGREDRYPSSLTMSPSTGHMQPGQMHVLPGDDQGFQVFFTKTATQLAFGVILTDIGEEKLAQKIANGEKLVLHEAGICDGNGLPYTPTKDMAQLVNEVWRGPLASYDTFGNVVRILTKIGSGIGNFTCRAIGIFDEDNDMIAIASLPATEKIDNFSGIDFKLEILVNLIVTDASAIAINITPHWNTVDWEELDEEVRLLKIYVGDQIAAHNASSSAHPHIQTKISTDIAAHNSSSTAHTAIRNSISNHIANTTDAHGIDGLWDAINSIDTGGGGGPTPVINNLNSTSTTSALSAAQGKVLNDRFEAGTWTPQLANGPGAIEMTDNGIGSRYVRVGRMVTVYLACTITNTNLLINSNTNQIQISNLPFASAGGNHFLGSIGTFGGDAASLYSIDDAQARISGATLSLQRVNGNPITYQAAPTSSTWSLTATVTYETN